MHVTLRQYPCGDELNAQMLHDMNVWIMELSPASRPPRPRASRRKWATTAGAGCAPHWVSLARAIPHFRSARHPPSTCQPTTSRLRSQHERTLTGGRGFEYKLAAILPPGRELPRHGSPIVMSASQMTSPTPDASQERRTLRARGGARSRTVSALHHNRLLALVLLCGSCVIGLSGLSIAYHLWLAPRVQLDADQLIARTLSALESGQQVEASQAVLQLRTSWQLDPRERLSAVHPGRRGVPRGGAAGSRGRPGNTVPGGGTVPGRSAGLRFPTGSRGARPVRVGQVSVPERQVWREFACPAAAWQTLPQHQYELARALATAYLRDTAANLEEALRFEQLALRRPVADCPTA